MPLRTSTRRQPTKVERFVLVGLGGFLVQTAVLAALTELTPLHYLVATALAVEAAVLHNFVWHERWTWRTPSGTGGAWQRVLRFHAATALLSVLGNLGLMWIFTGLLRWPALVANLVAVVLLSLANFRAADRWVFRARRFVTAPNGGRSVVTAAGLLLVVAGPAFAGPPSAETVAAWNTYVAAAERRIDRELNDGRRFLAMDFDAARGSRDRRRVLRGEVLVEQVETGGSDAGSIDVPGGMIHHWRGYVFIPGARLNALLSNIRDPTGGRSVQQEDVLETRVLSRQADGLRLFLKLQRRSLVSVAYNTEHDVRYRRHSDSRASSRSVATKIVELDDVGLPSERERAADEDHGFLWRMNSYWRYEAVPGGVIVELESLTLSRGLPWGTRTVIRPLVERVANESIERTLVKLGQRIRLADARTERRPGATTS